VPTLRVLHRLGSRGHRLRKRDRKRVAVHGVSFSKARTPGQDGVWYGRGGFKWSEPIAAEFSREVEFGMTPMQAIQSATSRAADLLGKRGEIGVVHPARMRTSSPWRAIRSPTSMLSRPCSS